MSLSSGRRWILYTVVALVFATGVWYFGFRAAVPQQTSQFSFRSKSKSNLAVPVRAVPAQRKDLLVHLRAIGTVMPLNIVTVKSRVEGQLLKVAFEEGQAVEKGQLLAEIDPLTYKSRLAQAEANQRQNESQLRTAKADLARFKSLATQNLVTPQQLEAQQALVAEREGAVAADAALVEDARRQLAYTKIEAPIPGRLGMRLMDAGNLVRPNDATGLVVITQTQPITVTFTVPEIDLQKVVEPLRAGEHLEVEAWDRTEQIKLATGLVKTMDNQIDLATGTLRLKAEFPNTDEKLFPNQFVNVRLRVRTIKDATVVPAPCIQYGSRGTYVYVVTAEQKATVREVTLGAIDGSDQAVTKGLQVGELVVLEGIDRLREGRPVALVTEEAKSAPTAPKADGPKGERKKKKKDQ